MSETLAYSFRESKAGSLAIFTAMRRGSSIVSTLAVPAAVSFSRAIDVGEGLAGRVLHHIAAGNALDVPRWLEAARLCGNSL